MLRQALALLLLFGGATAQAESLRYCDAPPTLEAAQQDRLLRVAAVVRDVLAASGSGAALISRSGQNLDRFGQRYSHAGVTLASSTNTPWSVRQLYFACDEGVPRLFDQGLAGFVMGTENPALGYLSIVLLPPRQAQALEARALDNAQALRLLGARYSANAYPFELRYQNCNQWLAELLAAAWGGVDEAVDDRPSAQRWLKAQGFEPTVFELGSRWLAWLGALIPWVHADDHPAQDRDALVYRVSMPASIEGFVRRTVAGAERIEICHDRQQVVVRRGWEPLAEGCVAGDGDRVVRLDR